MNWGAAAFAFASALVLAGLLVGYAKVGDWIQRRWGTSWAIYYGCAVPLALLCTFFAGISA